MKAIFVATVMSGLFAGCVPTVRNVWSPTYARSAAQRQAESGKPLDYSLDGRCPSPVQQATLRSMASEGYAAGLRQLCKLARAEIDAEADRRRGQQTEPREIYSVCPNVEEMAARYEATFRTSDVASAPPSSSNTQSKPHVRRGGGASGNDEVTTTHLKTDETHRAGGLDVKFKKGTKLVRRDDTIIQGTLVEPTTFETPAGTVVAGANAVATFRPDGRFYETFEAGANATLLADDGNTYEFMAGDVISLSEPNGTANLGALAKSYAFKTKGRTYKFGRGALIGFHSDGSLRVVRLDRAQSIRMGKRELELPKRTNVVFKDGIVDNVYHYGRELTFEVTAPKKRSFLCRRGTAVMFTPDGIFTGCRLKRDEIFTVRGTRLQAIGGTEIRLDEAGNPTVLKLKNDVTFTVAGQTVPLTASRSSLHLHSNGIPRIAYPARDFDWKTQRGVIPVKSKEQIGFEADATLAWASPSRVFQLKTPYGDLPVKPGVVQYFHNDGGPFMVRVARKTRLQIDGRRVVVPESRVAKFAPDGSLERVQ